MSHIWLAVANNFCLPMHNFAVFGMKGWKNTGIGKHRDRIGMHVQNVVFENARISQEWMFG